MAGSPVTPFDLTTITSAPETDSLMVFRDGGENDITLLNFLTSVRTIADANLTSVRLATLDATGILNVSQLPAGYDDSAPLGTWAIDNTSPVLSDSGGSTGDKYRIVASGTIDEGAGSLAINGQSVNAGDLMVKGASAWYIAPKVANQFDGSTGEDSAAALGDYLRTGDVNDRTNGRQISNAVTFTNDQGRLDPASAYPSGSLTDKFTAFISVRFNALPSGADAQFLMLSAGGTLNSSTNGGLQIETDGTIDASMYDGAFKEVLDMLGGSITLGKVYRFALRLDSANDGLAVFSDGKKKGTVACGATVLSTPRWIIGARNDDNTGTEVISFVSYNRALSDEEIALEFADQNVKVADQWGGADLAVNGGFETWGGSVPSSWTKGSAITIAKETTDVQEGTNAVDLTGAGNITATTSNWLRPTTASCPRDKWVRFRAKVKLVSAGTLDLGTTYYRILSWNGTTVNEDSASGWSTQYPSGTIGKTSATSLGSGWYQLEWEAFHASTGDVDFTMGGTGQWLIDDVEIEQLGSVAAYLPENIESDGSIVDASSNELNAAATNVTPLRTKPQVSGTFTPSLTFGGGSTGLTYATNGQQGYWRKLDEKTVLLEIRITLSAVGSSTGNAVIEGLPFTSRNPSGTTNTAVPCISPAGMTGLTGVVSGDVRANNTTINLFQSSATGETNITHAVFTGSSSLKISAIYAIE